MKPQAFAFDEAFGEEDEEVYGQQPMEVDGGHSRKVPEFARC